MNNQNNVNESLELLQQQRLKQQETAKKFGSLIIRLVIIVLCCLASYKFGTETQAKKDNQQAFDDEKETLVTGYEYFKKKYLYILKTTYCPNYSNKYYCRYSIYDINKDGIPELFLTVGSNSQDVMLSIYTIRNSEAVKLAYTEFTNCTLLVKNDKVFISEKVDNKQTVYKLSIFKDTVKTEQEFKSEDTVSSGEYSGTPLDNKMISDLSILENYDKQ